MSHIRKLLYLLNAQDLELDKYSEDILRATVLCKRAILSSHFCVNTSYKVDPYKYSLNYIQGSLLKQNFHRGNILILHNFFSYCFVLDKILVMCFCRPNCRINTFYCKIQCNYYGNAFTISVECLKPAKLNEMFLVR